VKLLIIFKMVVCIIFVYNLVSRILLYIIIARNSFCILCMHIQLPNICPVDKPSIFHQPINPQGHKARAISMHYNQQHIFKDMISFDYNQQ